jgi:hypothetical protein
MPGGVAGCRVAAVACTLLGVAAAWPGSPTGAQPSLLQWVRVTPVWSSGQGRQHVWHGAVSGEWGVAPITQISTGQGQQPEAWAELLTALLPSPCAAPLPAVVSFPLTCMHRMEGGWAAAAHACSRPGGLVVVRSAL